MQSQVKRTEHVYSLAELHPDEPRLGGGDCPSSGATSPARITRIRIKLNNLPSFNVIVRYIIRISSPDLVNKHVLVLKLLKLKCCLNFYSFTYFSNIKIQYHLPIYVLSTYFFLNYLD